MGCIHFSYWDKIFPHCDIGAKTASKRKVNGVTLRYFGGCPENCPYYEERNGKVKIVLTYFASITGKQESEEIEMPSLEMAKSCIKRNMATYLAPHIVTTEQGIIVMHLESIKVYDEKGFLCKLEDEVR